jgi:phospholipase/carboxylesterase
MDRPPRSRFPIALSCLLLALCAACSAKDSSPAPLAEPAKVAAPSLDYVELHTGASADGIAPEPLVVAVHGLGDRPENLADLYGAITAPCRLVLPRAPIPYGGGSSWFDIDIPYRPDAALAGRIADAADRVAALIDHLARAGGVRGKPVVTGFSQGGMISFEIAIRHPGLVAYAVPLSGALPPEAWPAAKADGPKPVIRAFHGAADDLIPIDFARRTVAAMKSAGYDVSLQEYPGVGHSVSTDMRRDALRVIDAALAR